MARIRENPDRTHTQKERLGDGGNRPEAGRKGDLATLQL